MKSSINPFDSQEAKPYKNNPEILAMTNLVRYRFLYTGAHCQDSCNVAHFGISCYLSPSGGNLQKITLPAKGFIFQGYSQ